MSKTLVEAVLRSDLPTIRFICQQAPKGYCPDDHYEAFREAIYAKRFDIADLLMQSTSGRGFYGDPLSYCYFWAAIRHDDPYVFDYFLNRSINVNYISLNNKWELKNGEEVYSKNVHLNAMSFVCYAYRALGESDSLRYMKNALEIRGCQDTPLVSYRAPGGGGGGGDGGCCEVQ